MAASFAAEAAVASVGGDAMASGACADAAAASFVWACTAAPELVTSITVPSTTIAVLRNILFLRLCRYLDSRPYGSLIFPTPAARAGLRREKWIPSEMLGRW